MVNTINWKIATDRPHFGHRGDDHRINYVVVSGLISAQELGGIPLNHILTAVWGMAIAVSFLSFLWDIVWEDRKKERQNDMDPRRRYLRYPAVTLRNKEPSKYKRQQMSAVSSWIPPSPSHSTINCIVINKSHDLQFKNLSSCSSTLFLPSPQQSASPRL